MQTSCKGKQPKRKVMEMCERLDTFTYDQTTHSITQLYASEILSCFVFAYNWDMDLCNISSLINLQKRNHFRTDKGILPA